MRPPHAPLAALAILAGVDLLAGGDLARAEAPYTPAPGSPERTAILDALRGGDRDRVFVVRQLRVADGWAWVVGDPRSRGGANRYETESALLQRSPAGWRVADQPCAEDGCDEAREMARIRRAHPQVPSALFDR